MGHPKGCPNICIIAYPFPGVNGFPVYMHKFSVFYKINMFILYNIPSCKIEIPAVLYTYKEVIPVHRYKPQNPG